MKNVSNIYFVGIKGIAMASLAVWARERGYHVSGSDIDEIFPSDEVLDKSGIPVDIGFDPMHIHKDIDLVIYTGAHGGMDNIEVQTARSLKIPVMPHGKALGWAMEGKTQISVAGSHGKTTTASMIATIFQTESYAIGSGEIRGLGFPGHHSATGEYFIAEADEYATDPFHDTTPRFMWQSPKILVVTNIDYDHPDMYRSIEEVQNAFLAFQRKQQSHSYTLVNYDDSCSVVLLTSKNNRILSYGESDHADFRITSIELLPSETQFSLAYKNKFLGRFVIHVPGKHNVYNAAAAASCYYVSHMKGTLEPSQADTDYIKERLSLFGGAKRRFEKIGTVRNFVVYDDYAHHPKEIMSTLSAARSWHPDDHIIAVFQPHTYSRTKSLLSEFARAFKDADSVICTGIYASSRESDTLGLTDASLYQEMLKNHRNVQYASGPKDIAVIIKSMTLDHGVLVFMGAGSIYSWENEILKMV